jgi:hypothetical protein
LEEVGVYLDVAVPLSRYGIGLEDGVHRALGFAGAAIDTSIRIDIKLQALYRSLALGFGEPIEIALGELAVIEKCLCMDTVYWTYLDAGGIAGTNARLRDDVGHVSSEIDLSAGAVPA